MARAGTVEVVLDAKSDRLRAELNKAQRQVRNSARQFSRQFDTISTSVRRTTLRVTALGAAITVALGGVAFRSILGVTARFQDLRDSLNAVSEDGDAAFKFIQTEAAKTQFSVEQLTGSYIQLAASGLTPTTDLIDTLANSTAIAKDSNIALIAVTDLFARATASSSVGLEDLNRVSDQGIPIFTILRKELGLARLELTAFGKTAEGSQKILNAFQKGIASSFGTASSSRLDNLSTGFSNFGDSINRSFARLGDRFSGSLLESINKVIIANEKLGRTYDVIGDSVDVFIQSFNANFDINQRNLTNFFARIKQVLPLITTAFNTFISVLQAGNDLFGLIPASIQAVIFSTIGFSLALNVLLIPLKLVFGLFRGLGRGISTVTRALFSTTLAQKSVSLGLAFGKMATGLKAIGAILLRLAGPAGFILLFGTALASLGSKLIIATTGQGTYTDKIDEYTKALERANIEQGKFQAFFTKIFAFRDSFLAGQELIDLRLERNFLLYGVSDLRGYTAGNIDNLDADDRARVIQIDVDIERLLNGPSVGGRIINALEADRPRLNNQSTPNPHTLARRLADTSPRPVFATPDAQLARLAPEGFTTFTSLFKSINSLGIEVDKQSLITRANGIELSVFGRNLRRQEELRDTLLNAEGLTLEERIKIQTRLTNAESDALRLIETFGFTGLPTEGPLQRPDRLPTEAPVPRPDRLGRFGPGPNEVSGQRIVDSAILNLTNTGIGLGLASRATAAQIEILVTNQRRLTIANDKLATGVNLTTEQISALRLEAIRAQGNIDGVTVSLQGITAPVNAVKQSFTEFGRSFSNTLKGSFEGVLRGTETFEKAFISALRATFIQAATDKIFDNFLTPILGQLFGSFSGAFGGLGSIFSVAGAGAGGGVAPVGTGSPPGLATGGPANRGMAYMVGERGRELFVPNQSGQVINNGLVERLLNDGGGGGQTNNFNVTGNVDVATLEAINRNLPAIAGRLNRFNQQSGA